MNRVVIGIVCKDGKVIMVRKHGYNDWIFPGGHVELDETAEEAVKREVKEETGLVVEILQELGSRVHPLSGVQISYYFCKYITGELKILDSKEIAEVKFRSIKEVLETSNNLYRPVIMVLKSHL